MKNKIILFLALTASVRCLAGKEGGGGDGTGLDFQSAAVRALQNVDGTLLDKQTQQLAFNTVKGAQFLVASQPLSVIDVNNREENPVAVNFPEEQSIYIDAKKWSAISREEIRQSLALHEILSLMKIEKNGDYHISSRLTNAETEPLNLAKADQIAGMDSQQLADYQQKLFFQMTHTGSGKTPFEVLKELFDTAPAPATISDVPSCTDGVNNLANLYHFLGVGLNSATPIYPETTADDIYQTANFLSERHFSLYIHTRNIQFLIQRGHDAREGQGPLYPAVAAQPDIYGPIGVEIQLDAAGSDGVMAGGCSVEQRPYNGSASVSQNKTDLVFNTTAGASSTIYLRKSGSLLAIKFVYVDTDSDGKQVTKTSYSYGWKGSL